MMTLHIKRFCPSSYGDLFPYIRCMQALEHVEHQVRCLSGAEPIALSAWRHNTQEEPLEWKKNSLPRQRVWRRHYCQLLPPSSTMSHGWWVGCVRSRCCYRHHHHHRCPSEWLQRIYRSTPLLWSSYRCRGIMVVDIIVTITAIVSLFLILLFIIIRRYYYPDSFDTRYHQYRRFKMK